MEQTHAVIYFHAKLVELAGVAIIVGGTLLSSGYFLREGVRGDWRQAYDRYRANLGRGILLGLELLVGADIMSTVTAPLPSVVCHFNSPVSDTIGSLFD